MITPPPRPRRLRLVAGSYRLGPVEEGTVVTHHHWGYEVRLHETGDIGTVDPIFVHDDPDIGMNPENWPAVGEIVRVRRQTTTPQGELRLTTRAGDLARPWAEPPDNGMNYQIVEWHRTRGHAQDPALIVSEMDSGRATRRIVEIYDDGRADLGDATSEPPVETGDTEVNCNPLPSLIMVNSSPEFTGHEVGRECFEALWRAARRQHPELGPEPPAPDPLREADDALTARIRELLEDLLARGESSAEAIGRIGAALREAAHRWHREDAVSIPTARFLVSVDCWIPQTCEHYSADESEELRTRLRNELLSALREAPSTLEEACKGIARYDPWDLIRSPLWAPAILLIRHLTDPESASDPGGLLLTELIVGMVYEHAQRWSLTGTMSPHHLLMLTCVQCALARTDEDGRARRAVRLLLDQFMR